MRISFVARAVLAPFVEMARVQAALLRHCILHWPNTPLGRGLRSGYVRLRAGSVGKNFLMNTGNSISGYELLHIGDNCGIAEDCVINLGPGDHQFKMGDGSFLGPGVFVRTMSHRHDDLETHITKQGYFGADIILGKEVWVAARCILLPGAKVGDHCVIAAGSVVSSEIPPYSIVAGNPARVVRRRAPKGT